MRTDGNYYWSMTEGAFNCLIDQNRTSALESALRNLVRPGDVVVDAGSGTGILSMIASRFGAKTIYAIEHDWRNAANLDKTFKKNGIDNIKIIEGDACSVDLPEAVDLITMEMIATGLIEELQVTASRNLLRASKPNTRALIRSYTAHIDLVSNPNLYYGFEFDVFRYEYPDEPTLTSVSLSERQDIFTVDFLDSELKTTIDRQFNITCNKSGALNGIRISGNTGLGDGSNLGATFAYDYPLILPISTRTVSEGEAFIIDLNYTLNGGFSSLQYSLKSG